MKLLPLDGYPPGNDLIFLSLENWDDIWRRNQFLCAELALRHPRMKILFVGLPRDVSNCVRTGNIRGLLAQSAGSVDRFPNIRLIRPLKFFPNTLTAGRKANDSLLRRRILQASRRLGLKDPILWINAHHAHHLVGALQESAVIYDITDDWTTLTQSLRLTQLIIQQDRALCSKADAVIVCSQKLHDMKSSFTENLHLIPNGVDANHYASVDNPSLPLPPATAPWKKPVFGYTGTIHPDRVDVALLEHVSLALPEATFALVGPNFLSAETTARLSSRGNIFFTGPVPYSDIPSYMRAFDVCMTPHRMTPFTESLNPIKLWEYLAAGKPIVSTNVAGFRDYPQYVRIATDPESFVLACREALAEDPLLARARRQEASHHSWESRVDAVEAVIAGALARRHAEASIA